MFYDRLTQKPVPTTRNNLTRNQELGELGEQLGGEVTVNLLRANSVRLDGDQDPNLGFDTRKDVIDKILLHNVTGEQSMRAESIFADLPSFIRH